MRIIYTSKGMRKIWDARYTLGARYLSKNTVVYIGFKGFSLVKLLLYNGQFNENSISDFGWLHISFIITSFVIFHYI